jgi:hypothetical protein
MIGVDSAYTLDGYVYHTSFDSMSQVPGEPHHPISAPTSFFFFFFFFFFFRR